MCPVKDDGTGGQAVCPFNYHCADAPKPYCVADVHPYAKTGGVWGTSCSPTGGFDSNPSCDSDQNFWCYGIAPTDGAAFCTQFDCQSDADCRGGYWCATINRAPNVVQGKRSVGDTRTACLPRTYCAPCAADVDCPLDKGRVQHCVADSGGAKFCAPVCTSDTECNQEAHCEDPGDGTAHVCTPNAGSCVGDGSMCAPCRSDADCVKGGACSSSTYSTEHFCTVPSGKQCTETTLCKLDAQCPTNPINGGTTSCTFLASDNHCPDAVGADNQWPDIPNSFCYGRVKFADNYVPGCYTARR